MLAAKYLCYNPFLSEFKTLYKAQFHATLGDNEPLKQNDLITPIHCWE